MAKAEEEMTYAPLFDRVLVNDDLETAFKEAEEMVDKFLAEPQKRVRCCRKKKTAE